MSDPEAQGPPTRDDVERHLVEDRLALERAEEQSLRIAATLARSRRVTRDALPRLRRALQGR